MLFLRPRCVRSLVVLSTAALAALCLAASAGAAPAQPGAKPTIVLVHGAFADASGFGAVTARLQDRGYTVVAPANPLRGPASDAAYVASELKQITGPIVLVAHSYGGAVASEAATQVSNVKALVYLDALALDEGESNVDIGERFPSDIFDGAATAAVPAGRRHGGHRVQHRPGEASTTSSPPTSPPGLTAGMATAQRPADAGRQPWRSRPRRPGRPFRPGIWSGARTRSSPRRRNGSWPSARTRTRSRSTRRTRSYLSHPAEVTALILRAAKATAG